jgi:hypothetical protein
MRRHVFVSHASAEGAVAQDLCRALEAEGLPCWIAPRDILPGADWAEQIIEGIDAAWGLLLVLGDAANHSPQVRREVERAVHKDVPVLALRTEDVALSKSLEYFLSAQHWIDAFGGPSDAHRAQVVRALRAWRDTGAATASALPGAPAPAPASAPTHWDEAALARIADRLALAVGPVAEVLVRRAAGTARTEAELLELLAREIDDPRARGAFVTAGAGR